jgi:hypothetical protein
MNRPGKDELPGESLNTDFQPSIMIDRSTYRLALNHGVKKAENIFKVFSRMM